MIPTAVYLPTLKEIWEKLHVFRVKKGRLDTQDLYQDDHFTLAPVVFPVVFFDSDGKPAHGIIDKTTGVFKVTEASAAAISQYTNYTQWTAESLISTIAPNSGYYANVGLAKHRIGRAVITCDGAGQFANVSLVAAVGGYYGVCKIISVKCNANVVAGAAGLTFESPAGTAALPSTEINPTLVANVRNKDWLEGTVITHAALTDNQAVVVDSIGTYGAGSFVEIFYEHWYET